MVSADFLSRGASVAAASRGRGHDRGSGRCVVPAIVVEAPTLSADFAAHVRATARGRPRCSTTSTAVPEVPLLVSSPSSAAWEGHPLW